MTNLLGLLIISSLDCMEKSSKWKALIVKFRLASESKNTQGFRGEKPKMYMTKIAIACTLAMLNMTRMLTPVGYI